MGKSAASTRRDLPLSAAFSRPEGYPPVCSRGIIFWSDPPDLTWGAICRPGSARKQ